MTPFHTTRAALDQEMPVGDAHQCADILVDHQDRQA